MNKNQRSAWNQVTIVQGRSQSRSQSQLENDLDETTVLTDARKLVLCIRAREIFEEFGQNIKRFNESES